MARKKKPTKNLNQNINHQNSNSNNQNNHNKSAIKAANTNMNSNNNSTMNSPKTGGRPALRVSPLRFEVDLEPIEEETDGDEEEESATVEDSVRPLLQLSKEDVDGEIQYWSTSVFCYILGANPPSSVISGFVKRVWQSHGVDKVSFLPNGIFIVRFKTKEQQQQVLNNGHLLFYSKPVIIKEWSPDVALIKHDVKQVPVWMKLYGLEIKFWGKECLKKLSGEVGKFIKCDDATSKRSFFGYARILIEVQIGQNFPKELSFVDELGLLHKLRVDYDWLPVSCVQCKGMGHTAEQCRKGEGHKPQRKVWKPKTQPVKPAVLNPQLKPAGTPRAQVVQKNVCTPVVQPTVTPLVTPAVLVPKRVEMSSFPRKILTRMMRQETTDTSQPSVSGVSFLDSLNMTISRRMSARKRGLRRIQADNAQLIQAKVFDKTRDCQFWFTLVYGFNKDKDRESLWESLISHGKRVDSRWMVCGDFNSLMHLNERIGGAEVQWHDVLPMKQMTVSCDLTELKTIGSFFTWNNKHENGSKVYSKIDRVLVNADWLNDFPDCFANFLPEGLFDHCPCVISFQEERERKGSPFKYFNMWSLVDDFLRVVETHWKKTVNGNPMFQVTQKLKTLKHSLKQLDRHNFSDIENITHVTEVALEGFQKKLRLDPLNQEICNAEYACSQELRFLKTACTQYLQQKSKENWMDEGDSNSAFFHASIKHRIMKNRVY
ncbi:uncharacterized protein LOC141637598 [Silene latifolia]|uniref:uncharacterized protein LOC141637598 n=1 Tax=Silene latifolia TaxID=37657 RepID=UPI003D789455